MDAYEPGCVTKEYRCCWGGLLNGWLNLHRSTSVLGLAG